jgi:hypothetical protein
MVHDVADRFPCKRKEMDFLFHGQSPRGNRINVDQEGGAGPRVVPLDQLLQGLHEAIVGGCPRLKP